MQSNVALEPNTASNVKFKEPRCEAVETNTAGRALGTNDECREQLFQCLFKQESSANPNKNGSAVSSLFTCCLKSVFQACGTCWVANKKNLNVEGGVTQEADDITSSEVWH